jgi:hypothetical protein
MSGPRGAYSPSIIVLCRPATENRIGSASGGRVAATSACENNQSASDMMAFRNVVIRPGGAWRNRARLHRLGHEWRK